MAHRTVPMESRAAGESVTPIAHSDNGTVATFVCLDGRPDSSQDRLVDSPSILQEHLV